MLYAEICPKVRRHNARPRRGSALCLLTLGHISAYNMDNTILFTGAAVIFSHHQVCIKKKKGGHFLGGQK
jgi:hypothetical protein